MVPIQTDGKGQPYIQWQQAGEGWKRAWIQQRTGDDDWAGTGRYLNVVWALGPTGGPRGNATDFPIFSTALSDAQILEAFVAAICAITGCPLP
jgi:hypothetical protein